MLNSAKAVGCNVIGVRKEDIASGKPSTTLGLLWQLIRIGLLSRIDMKYHPEVSRLKNPGEDMEAFLTLNPDQLLLRWVNHHLLTGQEKKKILKPRQIDNFGVDLKDSVAYTYLLNQLDGDKCTLAPLEESDLSKRATLIYDNAKTIGANYLITSTLIEKGSPKMNIGFIAILFEHKTELAPLSAEEAAKLNTALFDSEGNRESRAFCLWINSLGVEPFVTNLSNDLRSGLVLLSVMDKINPGLVDWKKVNSKDPNKFKQVENCNYVVEIGKKLNFSLVGIGGTDIANGNQNLTLGLVWQLMRFHVVHILKGLSTKGSGKEITEGEIVAWANSNVRGVGKTSKMESFRDSTLKTSKFIVDLLFSISPRSVDYSLVSTNDTPEDNLLNAKYAISIARKLGATIFVLPEDIVEIRPKMLLTFFGSVMAVALGTTEGNAEAPAPAGKK